MRIFFRLLPKAAAAQLVFLLVFVTLLSAERRISRQNVDPACVYIHITDDEVPLNIHLFRVDLQNPGIDLEPVLGLDGHPGLESVLDMVKRRDTPDYNVLMAINGDFWIKSAPMGLAVLDGRIVRTPSRWSSIAFSQDKMPQIGTFKTQIYLTNGRNDRIPIASINRPRTYNNPVLFTDVHGDKTEERSNGKSVILDPGGVRLPAEGRVTVKVKKIFNTSDATSIPDGMWVLSAGRSGAKALNPLRTGARWVLVCDSEPTEFAIHGI